MVEKDRPYVNSNAIKDNYVGDKPFSRKTWGLLSLELWYQEFHDQAQKYRSMLDQTEKLQAIKANYKNENHHHRRVRANRFAHR